MKERKKERNYYKLGIRITSECKDSSQLLKKNQPHQTRYLASFPREVANQIPHSSPRNIPSKSTEPTPHRLYAKHLYHACVPPVCHVPRDDGRHRSIVPATRLSARRRPVEPSARSPASHRRVCVSCRGRVRRTERDSDENGERGTRSW